MLESPRIVENKFPAPESVITTPSMVSISPDLSAHLIVKGRPAQLEYASQKDPWHPLLVGGRHGGFVPSGQRRVPTHLNSSMS